MSPDGQHAGGFSQLNPILERISDGFVALDRDWRYTYVNGAAAKMLQRECPQDLIGKHIWTEYPEGVGQPFHRAYEKAMQTQEPVVFEEYFEPWDLWFENRVYPSPDGLTVYFSDISARKKTEEALQQAATVFANTRDGIALTDERSNIVNVNPAFSTITGLTFEQVRGRSIRLLGDVPPDSGSWSEVLELPDWRGEILGQRAGGTVYEQFLHKNAVPGSLPGSIASVWVFSDISRERRSQRIERQLIEAQNLEVVGRLTGGVAHDFNNLLAAILGSLEVLRLSVEDDKQLQFIESAIDACLRGADLTKNMLSFSRQAPLKPTTLDLQPIVEQTRTWIQRTLPATIEVHTSFVPQLWKIDADRASTESALLNLILNARDAMPDGGKLTIECANVELDETTVDAAHKEVPPGRYVMLAVSDTGSGIPKEIVGSVFNPFFTTKPTGFGTGLGLSMVQGFMKQSHGTVTVYSEPGKGTSLKLYWPACEEGARVSPVLEAAPAQESAKESRNVLVAEDSAGVLNVIVEALTGAGYVVHAATSGDQAKAIFDSGTPVDVLLTDIVMPGSLQGPDLASALRQERPDLPVVFMTGYASEAAVNGSELHPDDVCLTKPVRLREMIGAIEKNFDEQ